MEEALRLYREQGAEALWKRTLGYLDYSLGQTMALQHQLLAEQLRYLQRSPLGRQLLGGAEPTSTAEFRERTPLTSYDDYDATLGEQQDDVLGERPFAWIRTSGRTRARHKWVPIAPAMSREMLWPLLGAEFASAANERGQINLPPRFRMLNLMAPPPYGSGTMIQATVDQLWPTRLFPSFESSSQPFEQRMAQAFSTAITEGLDLVGGLGAVLATIGETFGSRRPPGSVLDRMKNMRAFGRMGRAALRAKLAARPIYPRDVWDLRSVMVGGMDSSVFRERIREYWGRYPLEVFASSEGLLVAFQAWDCTTLTLVPTLNFFEFIPEDELEREAAHPGSPVRTVLMDELQPGHNYEMVITNFHGSPMVRYRTGDIFRFTAMSNPRVGIELPQAVFYGRRSDLLEVGGFVRLTEQMVWQAVEAADIPYSDWIIRKEVDGATPIVHLWLEPRPGVALTETEAQERIHNALRSVAPDWADMQEIAGLKPLRVTYLPSGSFDRYVAIRRAAGADLGQLKPIHMNPPDAALNALLDVARELEAVR